MGRRAANRLHVFGPAHERKPDEVGSDSHRHVERDGVGVGERFHVPFGARDVHAFARAQHARPHDPAFHVVTVDALDTQHDLAVGEEHFVADAHPLRELGNGGRHAVFVTDDRLRGEHEPSVHAELDLVVLHRARAQLRTGQVDEHADDDAQRRGCGARN